MGLTQVVREVVITRLGDKDGSANYSFYMVRSTDCDTPLAAPASVIRFIAQASGTHSLG